MKNYYEILEVDKKASSEVIDKAYRTLVKKYHPDLQENGKQKEYEEKMKDINEAYSVLSDDYKRTTYDEQLQNTTITSSEYEKVVEENTELKNELEKMITEIQNKEQSNNRFAQNNNYQNIPREQSYQQPRYQNDNTIYNMGSVMQEEIRQATEQAYNKAYRDAYIKDMKNRGYKIRYKRSLKYYIKLLGCIIVVILIFALIYQIPIVKRFFTELYEENIVFRAIINIFKNTFTTKFW